MTDPAWAEARRGLPAANAGRVFPAEVLSPEEIGRLLRRCSPRTPSGVRNRALIVVMWRAGLRVGEAVGREHRTTGQWLPGILARDVDLDNGLIRVTYGKGNRRAPYKPRAAAIDPEAGDVIARWIDKRRELGIPPRVQLFCTIAHDGDRYGGEHRPLSATYVRNLLHRLARVCELDKRVHPHGLRHTHAFELSMERQPMNLIQQQLGHSSLAVTGRYLDHIAPEARAAAMRSRVLPPGVLHDEPSA